MINHTNMLFEQDPSQDTALKQGGVHKYTKRVHKQGRYTKIVY